MWNKKRIAHFVKSVATSMSVCWLMFTLAACQSVRKLELDKVQMPVMLELKGESGRKETTDYHTESSIKTTSSDKIGRNVIERMDFTTHARITKFDKEKKQVHQTVTVIAKDGGMELHDLAFPELDEKMSAIYSSNGQVIQAGEFEKQGIFYVPRISLPDHPVKVGDTWTMNWQWVSSKNKIRMQLELVTIFKRLVQCGFDACADLEVSGRVKLPGLESKVITLDSTLKGRILFAIRDGVEVWSEIRNRESMTLKGVRVDVQACMESVIRSPKHLVFNKEFQPDCQVPLDENLKVPL